MTPTVIRPAPPKADSSPAPSQGVQTGRDHRAEVEAQAREALKSQFVLDKVAEAEEVTVGETELSAWLVQNAPRYGMAPDQFAQALVEAMDWIAAHRVYEILVQLGHRYFDWHRERLAWRAENQDAFRAQFFQFL